MRKNNLKRLGIFLLPLFMIGIDYGLATYQKSPIFAVKVEMYKDGGTKVYQGLGYKVIDYNQLDGRDDIVIISALSNREK